MGTGYRPAREHKRRIWKTIVTSPLHALFSKAADFAVPLSPMKSTGWLMLKNCLTWSLNTSNSQKSIRSSLVACWKNNSCEKWVADQIWISCRVNGRNKDLVEVKPRRRSKWLAARQGWNTWKGDRKAQRVVNQVAVPSNSFRAFSINSSEKMEMLFSIDLSFSLGSLWKIRKIPCFFDLEESWKGFLVKLWLYGNPWNCDLPKIWYWKDTVGSE